MPKTALTLFVALSLWALSHADPRGPKGVFLQVVDGTLVKESRKRTVYVVDSGVLRPLTGAAFRQLYADFSRVVTVVEIPKHLVREPLEKGTRLVKTKNDPTVWFVDNGHTKRHVADIPSFRRRGFSWKKVALVRPEEIASLPVGDGLE